MAGIICCSAVSSSGPLSSSDSLDFKIHILSHLVSKLIGSQDFNLLKCKRKDELGKRNLNDCRFSDSVSIPALSLMVETGMQHTSVSHGQIFVQLSYRPAIAATCIRCGNTEIQVF